MSREYRACSRALRELRRAYLATDEFGREWARGRPILITILLAAIVASLYLLGVF